MPSPATEEDRHPMIGDEAEEDDSDSEMDMDEDSEDFDEESRPVQPMPNPGEEEDSPSSSTDDENRTQNPNPNSNNDDNHNVVLADPLKQEPQPQHQKPPPSVPVSTSSSRNGGGVAASMQASPLASAAPPVLGGALETPEAKRPKFDGTIVVSEERKSASSVLEDSRRLFQRLWTDEDEIAILQGFYEFTSQRGTTHHAHQHDTGPFYDQIRTKLQLDFNKNQLVEKLRRLKKKYRNVVNRMNSGKDFVFKSPHDQATFEISRKIWSNSIARTGNYDQDDDDDANDGYHNESGMKVRKRAKKRTHPDASVTATVSEQVAVEVKVVPTLTTSCPPVAPAASTSLAPLFPNVVEETVRNCLSPVFKEILSSGMGGSMVAGLGGGTPLAMGMMPLSLMGNPGNLIVSAAKDGEVGEKWRKQQILELKVYSKRLELVQEQINATLLELQSDHK